MRLSARSRSLAAAFYAFLGVAVAYGQPAWHNQPQFFNFAGPDNDPRLKFVPFTGQAWGSFFSVYPAIASVIPLQQDVAAWKAQNGTYFAAASLGTIWFTQGDGPDPAWDPFRMRSLNGDYLDKSDARKYGALADYSLSSATFQNFLIATAAQAVDGGADGLQIDDVQSQLADMLYYTAAQAGSFDAVTMSAFQTYLQQKYSASVLAAQFGIADITSFNFAAYVQANGLASTWNQQPLTGLSQEFFLFKRQESLDFLRTLIASTKQYAQQKYGRSFLFTCNDNDDPLGYFVTEVMDQTTPELFYIQGMNHPFGAIDIKSWTGWKAPTIPLAETAPPALNVANPLTAPTVNLERVIIADMQAAGGMPGATLEMNSGLGSPEAMDLSVVNRYASFILANPQIMSQTTTPARVALLHSAPSVLGGVLSNPGQNDPWNGPTNYTGMSRLLLDGGFTYDAVFLPDTTYSQMAPLQATDLARYSVVIAPSTFSLDDNQVAALLAYAQQGGILIIDGDFATNEPSGAPASHPQLGSILAAPGQTTYGAGSVVFSTELFGVEYQATSGGTVPGVDNAAERQARASFQTFITPYIQPDVRVIQLPAQVYEPGITPFLYRDRAGNTLVHLVNYDYDLSSDQFYTKANIQVQVQVGAQAVDDVVLRSPDFAGAHALPFARSGGTITVTVPEIDAWVVLYFQQNALAPVIASASPSPTLGAVGGSSLSFSVSASDPDGNPLAYTWSVNGQVATNVFGPAYSLQLPPSASGTYTVTVTVTDGSRITETSWNINVAAYRAPRLLFDETHAERNTMDSARAQQLNPQHPSWVLFSILEQALAPDYQVTDLLTGAAGSLTPQLLSGTDVLVLAAPDTPLTLAENQAVSDFVQSGGGLIFLGDDGLNTSINTLTGPWGIGFNAAGIESAQNPACAGCFYLSSFANSPAVGLNPSFYTNYGGSLTISQGRVTLGQTSAAEWESVSGAATQQPGDPNGPFVMVGAAQFGKGRVFVVSDNAFHDDYLQWPSNAGNLNLFLSGLGWVSSSVNPPPAPPPATTAVVKATANGGSFTSAISPGSWASVFGSNLANTPPAGRSWTASDFQGNLLPTTLSGTSVRINGRSAAVYFISPGQLNVQAPDDTTQGTVPVEVVSPLGIARGTATLAPAAPSVFPVAVGGVVYAAALAADGTLLAGPGQIPGARAANPGETVEIFGTGFGETLPPQPAGQLVTVSPLANTVTATVCGQSATVAYAGLVEAGLNQVNVTIPNSASGNCAVVLAVAGQSTQGGVVLPVAK